MRVENWDEFRGGVTIHLYWSEVHGLVAELPHLDKMKGACWDTRELVSRLSDFLTAPLPKDGE